MLSSYSLFLITCRSEPTHFSRLVNKDRYLGERSVVARFVVILVLSFSVQRFDERNVAFGTLAPSFPQIEMNISACSLLDAEDAPRRYATEAERPRHWPRPRKVE